MTSLAISRVVPPPAREQTSHGLQAILSPRSVAVVGASPNPLSVGHNILRNILRGEYTGVVYPIHPTARAVLGLRAYPSVLEVPDPVDLAVVVVPANQVLRIVDECGRKGVKGLVVISAGFRETGEEGAAREDDLAVLVRRHCMRLVGPNCLGVMNTDPRIRLNATFAPTQPDPGPVALMTQSGALGIAILEHAARLRLGVGRFVSMGNKTDVSGNDLLLLWENDPDVGLILMYLEGFGNPRNFVRIARRVGRTKPIMVVKSGRSPGGARAASSHTGAMAETDRLVDALFEQCGVLRAGTLEELFDYAQAISLQPLPEGNRVAIVTNSGGPAIMAADALETAGLRLAEFSPTTCAKLAKILVPEASASNPVDLLAAGGPATFKGALETVLADSGVDAALVIYTTPMVTNEVEVAEAIVRAKGSAPSKPLVSVFLGRAAADPGDRRLVEGRVPVYPFPESAVRALGAMHRLSEHRRRPEGIVPKLDFDASEIRRLLPPLDRSHSEWAPQAAALDLVTAAGIRVAGRSLAPTVEAAVAHARRIGYPVVLKGEAPGLVHKTEVGGVRVGLRSDEDVRAAFEDIRERMERAGLKPLGALVMEHVSGGTEAFLGLVQDPKFGPLVAFGLGGIFVEHLGDVVYRLAPLTDEDARRMVKAIRAYPLLAGVRNQSRLDIQALETLILQLSQLAVEVPEIEELDLNPVMILPEGRGVIAVDARVKVRATTLT